MTKINKLVLNVQAHVFAGPLSPGAESKDYSSPQHFINHNLRESPDFYQMASDTRQSDRDTMLQVLHTGSAK